MYIVYIIYIYTYHVYIYTYHIYIYDIYVFFIYTYMYVLLVLCVDLLYEYRGLNRFNEARDYYRLSSCSCCEHVPPWSFLQQLGCRKVCRNPGLLYII